MLGLMCLEYPTHFMGYFVRVSSANSKWLKYTKSVKVAVASVVALAFNLKNSRFQVEQTRATRARQIA